MGRWEQREAVVAPGIAAADIGCTDRAIDRKNAFPREASGIPSTYTEQVIRAASGTLQDPRLWCWSRGRRREGKQRRRREGKQKGKGRLPRRKKQTLTRRAGRREGQRAGRRQRGQGRGRCVNGRELLRDSASRRSLRRPSTPQGLERTHPGGSCQVPSPTSGRLRTRSPRPLVSRDCGQPGRGPGGGRGPGSELLFFSPLGRCEVRGVHSLSQLASSRLNVKMLW